MLLAIGRDCMAMQQLERNRRLAARLAERFAEYQVAAATFFPMSKRAGHFGPRMTPLTEKAERFLADMEADRIAIVGADRYAAAIAEQEEIAADLGIPMPGYIITGLAFSAILDDMDVAEDRAPYGVRRHTTCSQRPSPSPCLPSPACSTALAVSLSFAIPRSTPPSGNAPP